MDIFELLIEPLDGGIATRDLDIFVDFFFHGCDLFCR